jgi:hypothetical protein
VMKRIQSGRRRAAAPPTTGGRTPHPLVLALVMGVVALMTACGDNDNGQEDTLFTGLSGLAILALAVWFVLRAVKKRR